MQLNDTFPTHKLILIIILFVTAWEVRASENMPQPELMGLAVRSAEGVFLLSDKEIPLANIPVNFFALFMKEVQGTVELDLSGPINVTREELAEPYGLFEAAEFKSLPEGRYALTVKIIENGQTRERHDFDFTLKTAATASAAPEKLAANMTLR